MSIDNSSNHPNQPYVATDLAILIPTKDRPDEVHRLLNSIAELDCKVGRIIVIASGQDIRDVVLAFKGILPVEYYSSLPGQIRQRNLGISLLDDSTRLVASLDDDAKLYPTAVSEMIHFWNSLPAETAGVGFNVVTLPGMNFRWHDALFGLGREPGRVMRSGRITSVMNVKKSMKSEWLNGGATVWRQEILKTNPHLEVRSHWAVYEDVIFSYPIGCRFPLYICADAKIEIEDVVLRRNENVGVHFYRGKTQFLWGFYFVLSNPSLSLWQYCFFQFLLSLRELIKGVYRMNYYSFFWAAGALYGFFLGLTGAIKRQDIVDLLEEHT